MTPMQSSWLGIKSPPQIRVVDPTLRFERYLNAKLQHHLYHLLASTVKRSRYHQVSPMYISDSYLFSYFFFTNVSSISLYNNTDIESTGIQSLVVHNLKDRVCILGKIMCLHIQKHVK